MSEILPADESPDKFSEAGLTEWAGRGLVIEPAPVKLEDGSVAHPDGTIANGEAGGLD